LDEGSDTTHGLIDFIQGLLFELLEIFGNLLRLLFEEGELLRNGDHFGVDFDGL